MSHGGRPPSGELCDRPVSRNGAQKVAALREIFQDRVAAIDLYGSVIREEKPLKTFKMDVRQALELLSQLRLPLPAADGPRAPGPQRSAFSEDDLQNPK